MPRSKSALADNLAPQMPALVEPGTWEPSDGILFSVVSSLALWCFLFASVYGAVAS